MKMKSIGKIIAFLLFINSFWACQQGPKIEEVDTQEIKIEFHSQRLDKELTKAMPLDSNEFNAFQHKYGNLWSIYWERILNVTRFNDPSKLERMNQFLNDKYVKEVHDSIAKVYPNMQAYDEELMEAWKRYHHFYPAKVLPEIVYYFSGFSYQVSAMDGKLGVGLDHYLGSKFKPYEYMQMPKYKVSKMNSTYLVRDIVKGLCQSEFPLKDNGNLTLLEQMIYSGKTLYFTKSLMPEMEDSVLTGFSSKQLAWCKENEGKIWEYIVGKKYLFNTNEEEYFKFLSEGPSTNGLPKESPSQLGWWIGYRIIESYLNNNKSSLVELMNQNAAQEILNKSKYKPKA